MMMMMMMMMMSPQKHPYVHATLFGMQEDVANKTIVCARGKRVISMPMYSIHLCHTPTNHLLPY